MLDLRLRTPSGARGSQRQGCASGAGVKWLWGASKSGTPRPLSSYLGGPSIWADVAAPEDESLSRSDAGGPRRSELPLARSWPRIRTAMRGSRKVTGAMNAASRLGVGRGLCGSPVYVEGQGLGTGCVARRPWVRYRSPDNHGAAAAELDQFTLHA